MSKQKAITEWLMQCPMLSNVWNISAEEQDGANVVVPVGASEMRQINDRVDACGCYEAEIVPFPSVYEEYQINCFRTIVANDNDFNTLKFDEVEEVINWIISKDENGDFPQIGKTVVAVDCYPFIPQVRGVDPDTGLICYYITLRITYVNTAKGRCVEWQQ
jgi:hypothetical protein